MSIPSLQFLHVLSCIISTHSFQLIHVKSFISIHSFEFLHFTSFIPISSCQVIHFFPSHSSQFVYLKSLVSIHSFQFMHVIASCRFIHLFNHSFICSFIPSFIPSFQFLGLHALHANSFMSNHSFQFIKFMRFISFQFTSFPLTKNSHKPCPFFKTSAPARAGHYLVFKEKRRTSRRFFDDLRKRSCFPDFLRMFPGFFEDYWRGFFEVFMQFVWRTKIFCCSRMRTLRKWYSPIWP